MLKNQKGITLVALIVTVVMMTILLMVTVNTSTSLINNSKLRSLVTTMYLVQAKLDVLNEKHDFDGTELVGDELTDDECDKVSIDKGEKDDWRKWKKETLNGFGIQTEDFNVFFVHYGDDLEVIYPEGFVVNGKRIYKLSELKDKDIE